jgi:large subunit ribosomal protein L19
MGARAQLGIKPGDTVRVHQKIQEKGKMRLQVFEGLVLARKHGSEAGGTFTVRRSASGVGVERVFPLYSPVIDKIEIIKRAKVRRAKLYYIREKVAREIKRQMRRSRFVSLTSEVSDEPDAPTDTPTDAIESEPEAPEGAMGETQPATEDTEPQGGNVPKDAPATPAEIEKSS